MQGQTDTAMPQNNGIKCNGEHMTRAVSPWVRGESIIRGGTASAKCCDGHVWVSEDQLGEPAGRTGR